ncbi:glutaredoxin-domain-containing protein [Hanseniaspora valbyensis NRRL Y-1626]|uniref:Glutaredoxin-domain-containing protein n=1 Tax=Hanseniaspora valbyensis NRRL Y-1626 TaxID=766949 RepID=A0A1B7T7S1_9ASCO|nr:glutaredoxin-domain-containing protein [Hanseniaspora valbyensis NRRL Y-1626]
MISVNKKILRIIVIIGLLFITFNIVSFTNNISNKTNEVVSTHLTDVINHNYENANKAGGVEANEGETDEKKNNINYGLKMTLEEVKMNQYDSVTQEAVNNKIDTSLDSSEQSIKSGSSALSGNKNNTTTTTATTDSITQEVGAKGVIYKEEEENEEEVIENNTTTDNKELTLPEAAAKEFENLTVNYPIIIFSKTYCPFSKGLKELFANFDITPSLKIVELDTHENGAALQEHIAEKTGRKTVPNVIIPNNNLQSLGGFDDFKSMTHEDIVNLLNSSCGTTCKVQIKE